MKIGFDLDRIFINYPPLIPSGLIDWFYRDHSKSSLSYSIPKSPLSQLIRTLSHLSPFRPTIKENIRFVHHLSQNLPPHHLFLISSRYKFLEKLTYELLQKCKLSPLFQAIYLNTQNEQPHLFKESVIKKLQIDLYIDDDLELLKYLKKHCPQTKFLWYNPEGDENPFPTITTIQKLNEIKQFLT